MGQPTEPAGPKSFEKFRDACARHPYWTLALVTLAVLAPFLARPFNIDDPLFIWQAHQIQAHPADPYGFNVNWFGFEQPFWAASQNPPLMSYYLAFMAGIFGWSEVGLHLACLLPVLAAVLGTYRLARLFCRWPLFAALATLFAPGFLVSAATIMCDVPMLALWLWATIFWVEGLRQNHSGKLFLAGGFTALAILTKYNGLCLLPLLAATGWLEKRRLGRWCWPLLIPVAALGAHEWLTFQLYGHPHLLASGQYAQEHQPLHGFARLIKAVNALTFTGGGAAIAALCAPWLWSRRACLAGAGLAVLLLVLAITGGMMSKEYSWLTGNHLLAVEFQVWLWTAGGVGILALALADAWEKRDAAAGLLMLWVLGTFAFAAFVYWMVNARVVLPMAPAVAILLARRFERLRPTLPVGAKISFVAGAVLSLLAVQTDFAQAQTARTGAARICARYLSPDRPLWFKGHFGFQYYLQSAGAVPLDFKHLQLTPGSLIAVQTLNVDELQIDAHILRLEDNFSLTASPGFATMDPAVGAGFYSQLLGPLPFAFGINTADSFSVYALKKPEEISR